METKIECPICEWSTLQLLSKSTKLIKYRCPECLSKIQILPSREWEFENNSDKNETLRKVGLHSQ